MGFSSLLKRSRELFMIAVYESSLSLDEAIETVVGISDDLADELYELQYELFSLAKKKNYSNIDNTAKLLKISPELSKELLNSEDLASFSFPVILEGKAKLARGIVVKSSTLFTNAPHAEKHVRKLSKILNENFSVIFDSNIVDNSFMLPLYVALKFGHVEQPYVFTGGLDENLNIEPCAFLKEKERACMRMNKILLSGEQFSNAREVIEFLNRKSYEVPFLACFSSKRDENYLKSSYEKLSRKVEGAVKKSVFEKISKARLIYTWTALKKEHFHVQIRKLYTELNRIVSSGGVPHISLIGPASLAMGLGMMLGPHNPVVLYHYQNNDYHRVIDLRENARIIKRIKSSKDFTKIVFEEVGEGKDCTFIVQFASHTPMADAEEFVRAKNLDSKIVRVFHRETGALTISDWTEEIVELMSLVQLVKSKKHFERFHFFFSVPVPIAFAFGMAFGHFAKASIYQFTPEGELPYFEAVKSEHLSM